MRPCGASLSRRCCRPVGVGFFAVLPMASPASSLSRSALKARDAMVLEHLALADSIASAAAWRLFPLVERDDLLQVAREALVRSIPRLRSGEPADPYLRRCISGALHHHLRDRVRLVRISRREHEKGTCPLAHRSLDCCPAAEGGESLLDQLVAPTPVSPEGETLVLEQLVEQLPAAQAAALRLTVLEGLSLRAAGTRLGLSAMTVQRAQQRAIAALRQQLVGAG
jgi:RNA polymerase sigma-B factor